MDMATILIITQVIFVFVFVLSSNADLNRMKRIYAEIKECNTLEQIYDLELELNKTTLLKIVKNVSYVSVISCWFLSIPNWAYTIIN